MGDDVFFDQMTQEVLDSYEKVGGISYLDHNDLPSRHRIESVLFEIKTVLFPGYFDHNELDHESLPGTTRSKLTSIYNDLTIAIQKCLCWCDEENGRPRNVEACQEKAVSIVDGFIRYIPDLRQKLKSDAEAMFDGDPAAQSISEVILAYPGFQAITVHRISHYLHVQKVPLIPRLLTELIHSETGIDIHPGATIGPRFCIDHGTGIVIGETADIGANVKIYQGVTIGALSVDKSKVMGTKRHPTLEDNVTVYSGTTILGGETVIGKNAIIGGNCWLIKSVPPNTKVYMSASSKEAPIKGKS